MPGIYIMGFAAMLVSVMGWGGLFQLFDRKSSRYLWLIPLGIPLSWIVCEYIKNPSIGFIGHSAGIPEGLGSLRPIWLLFLIFIITPITEELIKVLPLLIPGVRRLLTESSSKFWIGIMLGVGFGVGEAGYLAWKVSLNTTVSVLPWYFFIGFLVERWMACLLHAVQTTIFVLGINGGPKSAGIGYLRAVGLHALMNSVPMLVYSGFIPAWPGSLWTTGCFIYVAYLFEKIRKQYATVPANIEPTEIIYIAS